MAVKVKKTELTIGPLFFHWSAARTRDFWFRIADEAAVDTAYVGEVICSKRMPYFDDHELEAVAARLARGGKKVVWSTLAEVATKRDRQVIKEICAREGVEIEANDASALWHLTGRGHRVGQAVNVYNELALTFLASRGASHFCLPAELPTEAIRVMGDTADELGVGLEVQVFGRISLALSARCYHARAHGRTKDNCRFVCRNDVDGLELRTRTGVQFLAINGIQTLSHRYLNLAHDVAVLRELGVSAFRLSPHSHDMVAVAGCYRALLDGEMAAEDVCSHLAALGIPQPMANGFLHSRPDLKSTTPSTQSHQ